MTAVVRRTCGGTMGNSLHVSDPCFFHCKMEIRWPVLWLCRPNKIKLLEYPINGGYLCIWCFSYSTFPDNELRDWKEQDRRDYPSPICFFHVLVTALVFRKKELPNLIVLLWAVFPGNVSNISALSSCVSDLLEILLSSSWSGPCSPLQLHLPTTPLLFVWPGLTTGELNSSSSDFPNVFSHPSDRVTLL